MVSEEEQIEKWRGGNDDYDYNTGKKKKTRAHIKGWVDELYKEAEKEGYTDEKDILKYVNSKQEEQLIITYGDVLNIQSELETEKSRLDEFIRKLNKVSSIRGYIVGYEEDSDKVLVSMMGSNKMVYVVPRPADYDQEDMIPGRKICRPFYAGSQDCKINRQL